MNHRPTSRAAVHGFSLVEVTLALGIAVFCLVAIFGLLNVGINTSTTSVEQTFATNILSAVASDLRTAPNTFPKGSAAATTNIYKLTIPPNVQAGAAASPTPAAQPACYLDASGQPILNGSGSPATTVTSDSRYLLSTWMKPGVGRDATQVRLVVSWPPAAAVPASSVETIVALDRN